MDRRDLLSLSFPLMQLASLGRSADDEFFDEPEESMLTLSMFTLDSPLRLRPRGKGKQRSKTECENYLYGTRDDPLTIEVDRGFRNSPGKLTISKVPCKIAKRSVSHVRPTDGGDVPAAVWCSWSPAK